MSFLPKRIQMLKFVAEQGVVSVDDVRDYFGYLKKSDTPRVVLNQYGLGKAKFGGLRHGIRFINSVDHLNLLHSYFPSMPQFEVMPIQWHLVPHSLGINRIRVLLEKSSDIKICEWLSENYLRALPTFMRDSIPLSRLPDAIFYIEKSEGKKSKYFLEYERSLKNKQRYIELFQYDSSRDDVKNKNVIYICKNNQIVNYLKRTEKECVRLGKMDAYGKYFQFLSFDQFVQSYKNKKETIKHANF